MLQTHLTLNLSILCVPEYHTVLLSVRLVECIYHCVGEIAPLKGTFYIETFMVRQLKFSTCIDISKIRYLKSGAYPSFCSMKRLGVFLLPPGWMPVHRRATPSSKFTASTHLYTWVDRGKVTVKGLAQEYNTMNPSQDLNPDCLIWSPAH